mmetsp:Transcript_52181/g.122393  ORF Transcript_52181/g.122393 Transcript_52181/m.122393 type:complete len:270 (+) Transcript_52181:3505-4314(+)
MCKHLQAELLPKTLPTNIQPKIGWSVRLRNRHGRRDWSCAKERRQPDDDCVTRCEPRRHVDPNGDAHWNADLSRTVGDRGIEKNAIDRPDGGDGKRIADSSVIRVQRDGYLRREGRVIVCDSVHGYVDGSLGRDFHTNESSVCNGLRRSKQQQVGTGVPGSCTNCACLHIIGERHHGGGPEHLFLCDHVRTPRSIPGRTVLVERTIHTKLVAAAGNAPFVCLRETGQRQVKHDSGLQLSVGPEGHHESGQLTRSRIESLKGDARDCGKH